MDPRLVCETRPPTSDGKAMTNLDIYCAGAARAVVSALIRTFSRETGCEVNDMYGAVGYLKDRVVAGNRPDVVILTPVQIDELAEGGLVQRESRLDLGEVGTAVAVRAGTPVPPVAQETELRATLLEARRILCPDPAVATAGQVLLDVLARLHIREAIMPRLEFTHNGYEAMARLADGAGSREIGVVQLTEILACDALVLAGPLPSSLQRMTTYAAALVPGGSNPAAAAAFLDRLRLDETRAMLRHAGFVLA